MTRYCWKNQSQLLARISKEMVNIQGPVNIRRAIAQYYALRTQDRTLALTRLFEGGHYVPAVPLVRVAYEDWLSSSSLLLAPLDDGEIWKRSLGELGAEYARLYRRFHALCGKRSAKAQFPNHPPYAEPYLQQSSDPPHKVRDWSDKAAQLGLENVHGVVYNYLSDLAHGSFHTANVYIISDGQRFSPRTIERSPDGEELLAVWSFWFQLRTLTVAAREWDRDYEHVSNELLAELIPDARRCTMCTGVMRRERWKSR
ncbi:MAG: hypothetical protein M1617_07300 [Actinobacteria bacterium]|nr:hypothetical protein [Actinomycetota bacterium]